MHIRTQFLVGALILPLLAIAQANPSLVQERRAQLEAELRAFEQEIAQTEARVAEKKNEAESLQRNIAILDENIKLKRLTIQARTLSIQKLEAQIEEKRKSILEIEETVAKSKVALAESLRQLNEQDKRSALELALEYKDLARFFEAIELFYRMQETIQLAVQNLTVLKQEEETARIGLEQDRREEVEFRTLVELERKSLETEERAKQNLLKVTKGQESEYRKILGDKQKAAASIRSQLFLLQGSPAISFERALEFANFASSKTSVRTAFILGIIAQESELGKNIGQCNLPDDPAVYKWQSVMKPSRDHAPFLAITQELGLDPNQMPVSCPMRDSRGQRVGWGGAMGPAQFIPSTWVLYKSAISKITGSVPPNPWNPRDAFVASALLLKDNGATGSRENERKAAAKYFAGGNWNSTLGRTYANQVFAKVDIYQEQIDLLESLAQQ